jgi:hypothetical protein
LACVGQRLCARLAGVDGGWGRAAGSVVLNAERPRPVIDETITRLGLVVCRGVRLGAGQCISIGITQRVTQVFYGGKTARSEEGRGERSEEGRGVRTGTHLADNNVDYAWMACLSIRLGG